MSSQLVEALTRVLADTNDKNYDPRMEELMRSDRLIDSSNEALTKLEEQEIFHIAKIRGAQEGFRIPLWKIRKLYNTPMMLEYHADYIDYVRALKPEDEHDKQELESFVGGLAMTNKMISELIKLRHAEEAWTAKLYADSIKPQVANVPVQVQPTEPQEGFFSKLVGFFFGKKEQTPSYSSRSR